MTVVGAGVCKTGVKHTRGVWRYYFAIDMSGTERGFFAPSSHEVHARGCLFPTCVTSYD